MQLVTFQRRPPGEAATPDERLDRRDALRDGGLGFDTVEAGRPGVRRLGAILPEGPQAGDVVDLNRALAMKLAFEDAGAPEGEADSLIPSDILRFLRRWDDALPAAQHVLDFVLEAVGRYDVPDLTRAGVIEPRRRLQLCAPLPRPGKILAVAGNYPAHVAEAGRARASEEPVLFLKAPSAVIGCGEEIVLPAACEHVDFEGELAVVIGRTARNVPLEHALDHVAGYSVANDVSARDFQGQRGQHFIGKSCDTFAPLGPALVSADAVGDPQDLGIHTRVSGELLQSARTKEMTFDIRTLVAFAARLMTLEPGDVLLTGTPAGVGMHRRPPRWLREGDVVEIEIERVGRLYNHVRRERVQR